MKRYQWLDCVTCVGYARVWTNLVKSLIFRLCFKTASAAPLIAACKCYKKCEKNRVHVSCLQRLLNDATLDSPPRCSVGFDNLNLFPSFPQKNWSRIESIHQDCNEIYTAKIEWNFKVFIFHSLFWHCKQKFAFLVQQ